MGKSELEGGFPDLKSKGYRITSPYDPSYNCIGWSFGDDSRIWWPTPHNSHYWPTGLPRVLSIETFKKAYEQVGYEECESSLLEKGFEKIAVYLSLATGMPTHAARQLPSGKWTSKLGKSEDVEHTLPGLLGQTYGQLGPIFKRKIR